MKLELPQIFGEGMIFQQGKPVPVWGKSAKHDRISIRLGTQTRETDCDENGCFKTEFPPMESSEKLSFSVSSVLTGERISFSDCAVGEVFLCGGQSNMEFLLKYDVDAEKEYETEEDSLLRMFTSPQVNFEGAQTLTDCSDWGFWRRWDRKENRELFGAIPLYMAKILRKELKVPVGMIACNWGGTPAAAWASMEEIQNTPAMAPVLSWQEEILSNLDWKSYFEASEKPVPPASEAMKAQLDNMMMGIGLEEFMKMLENNPDPMPMPVYSPYVPGPRAAVRPAGLYETMLKKVAPFAISGVIWYQGEDDDFRGWAGFYDESMKAVIRSWRKLWNEELPFYQVDLAPFAGRGFTAAKEYPLIRALQHKSSVEMPNAKDICIMDLGNEINIHPRAKRKAGERLALLALRYIYGKNVKADSPEFESAVREGRKLLLHFSDADEGLVIDHSPGDTEHSLKVMADGREVFPELSVSGNRLILSEEAFKTADSITVSYAEQNYCRGFLFDVHGLPVFPFHVTVA